MAYYENKTTLEYNEDETVLTLLVNEKPLHKYAFIPSDNAGESCLKCVFSPKNGNECDDTNIRCLPHERKDGKLGGYQIIENGN